MTSDAGFGSFDPVGSYKITDEEFNQIRTLIHQQFGIALSDQKRALVIGRLQGALRKHGLTTFREYLELLRKDSQGKMISELIDRISTNHTHFFRESSHFDFLADTALPEILPRLQRERSNDIRIWCAASATGEEPYTIQMTVMNKLGSDYSRWSAGLLATDISLRALEVARAGTYEVSRCADVPLALRNAYFEKEVNGSLTVKDEIRKQIIFRRFNLLNDIYPFNKPFHVIFIRNVMIYFDDQTREKVIRKMLNILVPGGYLFIGHSESLSRFDFPLDYVAHATYRKKEVA